MKLRFTAPASRDLDDILRYVAERSPGGAKRVQDSIESSLSLIAAHPRSAPVVDRRGTRRMVVSRYPYLIFYQETADTVTIHGVRHGARSPDSMPVRGRS